MMLKAVFSRFIAPALGSVLLVFSQFAQAGNVVDQSFTNAPYSSATATSLTGDTLLAQTFTVGAAGLLSGADVLVFDGTSWYGAGSPPVSDMTVQIRALSAGVPSAEVLASATVPASNIAANPNGQFTHVEFPTNPVVLPGQMLALTIGGVGIGWYLQIGTDATYPGGQAFTQAHASFPWTLYPDPGGRSTDFLFRTYVKTPDVALARMVSSEVTNGLVHVRFQGTSNQTFTIDRAESSAGPWQIGYTNLTSHANGQFELFDPVGPGTPAGFYRVR